MRLKGWTRAGIGTVLATVALTPMFAPQVLAFPYKRQVGDTQVYSDTPIPDAIGPVLARSDRLLRASAIYDVHGYGRRIFLTDGGWRWRLLSIRISGAMAQTRGFTEPVVVNRSDVAGDLVFNGATIGGQRSLAQVIAHERTHGLIRHHFGMIADLRYPNWLREGYCDVVAGGSSLNDADAAMLTARGESTPALRYYEARKRVAATLVANGGSVDRLFAEAR